MTPHRGKAGRPSLRRGGLALGASTADAARQSGRATRGTPSELAIHATVVALDPS